MTSLADRFWTPRPLIPGTHDAPSACCALAPSPDESTRKFDVGEQSSKCQKPNPPEGPPSTPPSASTPPSPTEPPSPAKPPSPATPPELPPEPPPPTAPPELPLPTGPPPVPPAASGLGGGAPALRPRPR